MEEQDTNIAREPLLPDLGEFFREVKGIYYTRFQTIFYILLITGFISVCLNIFAEAMDRADFSVMTEYFNPILGMLTFAVLFLCIVVFIIIATMWPAMAPFKTLLSDDNLTVKEAFGLTWGEGLSSFVWIYVLIFFLIISGLILFILPGIFLLVFFPLPFLLSLNENIRGVSAITLSYRHLKGNVFGVFWRQFVLIAVAIIIGISVTVGLVFIFNTIFPSLANLPSNEFSLQGVIVESVYTLAMTLIVTSLSSIGMYVLYRRIKVIPVDNIVTGTQKIKTFAWIFGVPFIAFVLFASFISVLFFSGVYKGFMGGFNGSTDIDEPTSGMMINTQ